jgi:hypothetical protein
MTAQNLRRARNTALFIVLLFPLFMCFWKTIVDSIFLGITMWLYSNQYNVTIEEVIKMLTDGRMVEVMRPDLLGCSFFVSIGGITLAAAGVAWIFKWPSSYAFGLRRASFTALLVGFIGGFFVGGFPSWVAGKFGEWFPDLVQSGALDLAVKMMTDGPLVGRILSIGAICVGAPILEELIFRGFLWNVIERLVSGIQQSEKPASPAAPPGLPTWVAFLATSFAFAAFHMDPQQSIAVLFISFFLGWIRLSSQSIWPAILAHFVNNTLATVLTISLAGSELNDTGVNLSFVLLSTIIVFALAALGWHKRSWRT